MPVERTIDLNDYTLDELARRLCNGLCAQAQSQHETRAVLEVSSAVHGLTIDAIALAEAESIRDLGLDAGRAGGEIAMQIFLDGKPYGSPVEASGLPGAAMLRASRGVTLHVPASQGIEVSAEITSARNVQATRVQLILAFQ